MNWSGPDLSGFGELVLEGSFKVHRVKKERAFFLFDKMLLIAKKRVEQFVYSTHIFVRSPACWTSCFKEPLYLLALICHRANDLHKVNCCAVSLLQCCNLLLVETLKDPLCFKVSDQTIPKQQHIVQVSPAAAASCSSWRMKYRPCAPASLCCLFKSCIFPADKEPGGEETVGSLPQETDCWKPSCFSST